MFNTRPLVFCLFILYFAGLTAPAHQLAVIPVDTPDPTAVITPDGKGIYVFNTGRGIPIQYSTNFLDWGRVDCIFSRERFPDGMPAWAKKAIPGANALWAPDVVFLNDRYYVYYSVSTIGSRRSAIGLVTNKTLDKTSSDYEWKDEGMVLESHPDITEFNALDSSLLVDEDGKTYLFWGSYWTGIKAVEINSKTGKPFCYRPGELKIPADYVSVASRPDTSIEAAYAIRHGKYYYLFTSRGSCLAGVKSTYHIAVGRSEQPLGPYVDREGKRMDEGGGSVLLFSTERWKGTGHNGFFRTVKEGNNRGDWLILAAYDAQAPNKGRLTQIRPLYWDESDWPIVGEVLPVPFDEFDFSAK